MDSQSFPHLRFVSRTKGRAKLTGGGTTSEQTRKNKTDRAGHSAAMSSAADTALSDWKKQQEERERQGLPALAAGVPLLLQIDPGLDLDQLRSQLGFEIVSEEEGGFVIVASGDIDLAMLMRKIREFATQVSGSAVVASVYQLFPESTRERLQRICPWLLEVWPTIRDDQDYIRVANPAQSLQALTVGSVGYEAFHAGDWQSFVAQRGGPSSFSRSGPGIWGVIKPEVVEFGGDYVYSTGGSVRISTPALAGACFPELIRSTLSSGPAIDRDTVGTSFAAPKVTHIAAHLASFLPDEPSLLYRALIVQSARWPTWALALLEGYRREKEKNQKLRAKVSAAKRRAKKKGAVAPPQSIDDALEQSLAAQVRAVMSRIGFGIPDRERATRNFAHRTTLITSGMQSLQAGECDILHVPVPAAIRAAGNDFDVLVEVTLSYAAAPRRTRRTPKRYLSVWLDWITNRRGESMGDFEARAIEETDQIQSIVGAGDEDANTEKTKSRNDDGITWTLGAQDGHGCIRGFARGNGTIQKDWAILKLHQLPETFCIAVRGHKGWSQDPDAEARYALAVSFEVLGQEVEIYEEVRVALEELAIEVSEG